jgi:hypothetical protein
MNAVFARRSNDYLLRCQSVLRAHVRPQSSGNASYLRESPSTLRAQGNADDDFPTGAPCIWPLLRHLQEAYGRISTRAVGAPRFLNRLHHPNIRTPS